MIQNAMVEMNLPSPTIAFNSSDYTILQMIALANREGKQLMQRHEWYALQKLYSITLVAGQDTYALPNDFDRPIDRTWWDSSNRWPMEGSISPQEWEWIKSGINTVTPRRRWRLLGSSSSPLIIDPIPNAGDAGNIITFEYISNNWCKSGPAALPPNNPQSAWAADTDIAILDQEVMTLGLKWRFLAANQLAYQDDRSEYENEVKNRMSQEKGARVLNTSNIGIYSRFPYPNIPDGNYG